MTALPQALGAITATLLLAALMWAQTRWPS